jgi:hypothetical protein
MTSIPIGLLTFSSRNGVERDLRRTAPSHARPQVWPTAFVRVDQKAAHAVSQDAAPPQEELDSANKLQLVPIRGAAQ